MNNYDVIREFIKGQMEVMNRGKSAYTQGLYDSMRIILDLMDSLDKLDNDIEKLKALRG